MTGGLQKAAVNIIRLYQRATEYRFPHRCVFTPTCSEYAILAIEKYGLLHGLLLTVKRLYRCRPGNGGEDFP